MARAEEAAAADDDLVGVVGVPLVADVVEPADRPAVLGEHPVAFRGSEESAEFSLGFETPLGALVRVSLWHGGEG